MQSELYTFLERARLASYWEVFEENGADDLDDLLKADDEELEEIITLVGMGSKPFHKMRLKRAIKGGHENDINIVTNSHYNCTFSYIDIFTLSNVFSEIVFPVPFYKHTVY